MSKKYCIVGASGRSTTAYVQPIAEEHPGYVELVGIYDINYGRACYVAKKYGHDCPVFKDFEEMIATAKPDAIVVCCTDYVHSKYIVRGLELGLEVFSEKPMCINAEQVEDILAAEKKYNRNIGVCFNMRFYTQVVFLKQLLNSGVIGDIYTCNLEWLLARSKKNGFHGASYYSRWNGEMEKSGGLLITKATHHFDMANWLIGQKPVRVGAFGKLRVYGPENAPFYGSRCSECVHASECEFFKDTSGEETQEMYIKNEKYDGYIVDKCVYRQDVNIYDCMAINVEYDGGCVMSYTETSTGAYEGFKLTLNGSKARMEVNFYEKDRGGIKEGEPFDFVRIIDMDNNITTYPIPAPKAGGHGGSDPALRMCLFRGEKSELPDQLATSKEGAYSVLVGVAANESIKTGKMITIREMLKDPSLLDK